MDKKILGSDEFLNGQERWCLWLVGISSAELQCMPLVYSRVQKVAEMRGKSAKLSTQKNQKYHTFLMKFGSLNPGITS